MAGVDYYALIPHSTHAKVLLLWSEAGWGLPRWHCAEARGWPSVAPFNRAMREQLRMEVTTLRCVSVEENAHEGAEARVLWMENHDPGWFPPAAGRWVGREELDGLTLAQPEQRAILDQWFTDTPGPLRPGWERPGGYAEAADWVQAQMDRLGILRIGRIEQNKTWSISSILQADTSIGTLYFKAVPDLFRVEVGLTRYMGELYPEHTPLLIAWEEARGWMLMRDMGGAPLRRIADPAKMEEVLRLYARIQREMETRTDALMALGCRNRGLDRMAADCAPLFADPGLVGPGHSDALSESEIEQMRALESQLPALCERLAEHRIPTTLEHGDFNRGNVIVRDQSIVFFDWTDGSVSHPFFSMFTLLEDGDTGEPERERLRDIYLEAWTDVEPMERLRDAYELAQALGALYHTLSYYWIANHVEPTSRWQWEGAVPGNLKSCLERVARIATTVSSGHALQAPLSGAG